MQNYYNDFEYAGGYYDGYAETEEERRKREQELANRAVQTQEIKTFGDGTVEETTKTEYAPAVQQVAMEPVAPVAPVQQMPVAQPVAQPVNPAEYNRQIAQQESGNRPDIGFHDRSKGSAYGTYGMTTAGYQDARKVNPNLPADITQATPEQQTAAMDAYTQQNARYLQNYGVEPTQQNLAAAHFLGAKGLSDYMKTGYISPQAAAANGGEENVRRIVNQRLGGEPAPASGAAQPAAPAQPAAESQYSLATGTGPKLGFVSPPAGAAQQSAQYISNYQAVQDDPMKLLALRGDESAPKFIRERAGEQAFELMNKEVQQKTAERQAQQLAAAAATGDRKASNTIARELQNKDGSWLKFVLLSYISPEMAGEEAVKLGYGNKWTTTTDADGKPALIQVNAKGLPLKGYTADGNEIATKDLVSYAAGGKQRDLDIVGGTYVNDTTKEVGRVVTDKRTGQSFIQTDTGRKPMTGFRPQSSTGTLEDQRARTIQDINLRLRGKGVEESMAILRNYNERLVGQGYAPVQPGEVGINVPQIGGAVAAAPGATMAAPGVAAGAGPVKPGAMPAPAMAPAVAGVPPATTLPAGQRPTMTQMDTQATIAKETAEAVGKDIGVTAANFGKAKDSAMVLINQAQSLVDDPGFSVSVGASVQPGFQFIPGTDKATWMAKKEEVVGKTFLTAIEQLKGFGALSDQEGRAATAAISRLNNTDQNEESYKAAVKELQDIVKRGVDRNAEKLGKPSVFGTEPFKESKGGAAPTAPRTYEDPDKEKRYQEYLKKRNAGK